MIVMIITEIYNFISKKHCNYQKTYYNFGMELQKESEVTRP